MMCTTSFIRDIIFLGDIYEESNVYIEYGWTPNGTYAT